MVTAGAGMGVDSGLPDFRGDEGFWRAYPALRGRSFEDMANPRWFVEDPPTAWGFYGHRLHLYRDTLPHDGFAVLRAWAAHRPTFVVTSNVDGQFQAAGFPADAVWEVHGSIHHLQRVDGRGAIWSAAGVSVAVDTAAVRAFGALPVCPQTGAPARPNVLMFGDLRWVSSRSDAQESAFTAFLHAQAGRRIAVVELGAGTAIPTIRAIGEDLASGGATLIRINPREPAGPPGTVRLASGARAALQAIGGP